MQISGNNVKIDETSFRSITSHMHKKYGINLTPTKQILVENRLYKRLVYHGFDSYKQYNDYLFSIEGKDELALLGDFLSTNKTYFYREPNHFKFIRNYLEQNCDHSKLSFWSAAASTGDEAYTLSILLNEHNESGKYKKVNYSILGTDISNEVLKAAKIARFNYENVKFLPNQLIKKYFTKTTNKFNGEEYQLNFSAKQNVNFKELNLVTEMTMLPQKFDFIFCRNVLIYFDQKTKVEVCDKLIQKLNPGGFLMLGHCESLICKSPLVKQIQPAVYQRL